MGINKHQTERLEEKKEDMRERGVSYREISKAVNKTKWNEFLKYLNNPHLINDAIKLDEMKGRGIA